MDLITIHIDDIEYKVEPGQTIMQAADKLGYKIPRLCYHPKLSIEGACRVCIVQVEGARNFSASCATPVRDGMKIYTNTPEVRRARRDIVELILDNHPQDCHTCERDGICELQRLSSSVGIQKRHFEGERKEYNEDYSSISVVRNPNKCILCGRCVRMCSEIQEVTNLGLANRGFKTVVMPAFDMPMSESVCAACGQCVNICPTAAFLENNSCQDVFELLGDKTKVKTVNVAPSVRASIGEAFGLEPGTDMEGQIFAALRKLGFDYVFDTNFAADLTIMEEASELVHRIKNGGTLPMLTSCSSGWMKFVEQFYPELLDHLSTCKSPMSMAGAVIKSYFAESLGLKNEDIVNVGIMPCTAKKFEASRPELDVDGIKSTDEVLTTRELAWMIKSAGINFVDIEPEKPDNPLSAYSGAGVIFGATGGVMEAAIRTAHYMITGEELGEVNVEAVRGMKGIKKGSVMVGDMEVRVAAAHGLGNAEKLLKEAKEHPDRYHFIEIMACPGGCIGGGGQPYPLTNSIPLDEECLAKRASALYSSDDSNDIRVSHDNPDIKKLYEQYLGEPLGEISHKYLHTHYKPKEPKGVIPTELPSKC
ncbi:NADP-reducing hydrogenase subunit HndC [Sedimentisphaera cyanobacteriorum]|uniref:NADP-reducing hydrogenase subunit HndC n=1 Tax=Sedimentisphaera cyanobacteriorum TaxID=1940790 RepID=A0A1Q2HMM3_9BACT|nr:NADH-dependent [FeFe] hydrogenase, group A6 [Sedimentisphaera cyanobacteriorum]AQQ08525.1 NADP-reducing hydrogenase subunit HndC [Sedimentisphaera cyanobacteriorum]